MHHRGSMNPQGNSKRYRTLRSWLILIGVIIIVAAVILVFNQLRRVRTVSATMLPCLATQNVTAFGEYVLYYDGVSIHCVTSTGVVRWSFQIGSDASFSVGEHTMVAWVANQLYIVDYNGRTTYKDALNDTIQFARVGKKYAAAVIGDDTSPTLVIKDLQGIQVDEETNAFAHMLMLDVGFYGDNGQYMWTTVLDVYGTAANIVLNTFEVGKMNTGEVSLGDALAYRVIYENLKLRVITTRQMRTFNYQGIESATDAMLVYGWKLIDCEIPQRGDALMLFASTAQTNSQYALSELRLLSGSTDRRYTLPSVSAGAAVYNRTIYAFSAQYIYKAEVSAQRFTAYAMPLENRTVTDYLGMLENGTALIACGSEVYALVLPT